MSKTATFIRELDGWRGEAHLYKLSEPMETGWEDIEPAEYVIVSGVVAYSGPETYIFPANEEGQPRDMLEIGGSFRGDIDHVKALNDSGYEVVR